MSTIKSVYLQHLNGTTPNATMDTNGNFTVGGTVSGASSNMFRNRIINGDMRIDQRNAGSSVTIGSANGLYTLDRYQWYTSQASKLSTQQSSTAPSGFSKSMLITSLSSYSVVSGDYFFVRQNIEGYNVADLAWGTADAKSVTLSFWVRSSVTGTYGGQILSSNSAYAYVYTYTINSANTWEYKTITISGATTGTWNTDNTSGVTVSFTLGSARLVGSTGWQSVGTGADGVTGQVNLVSTNGATWYMTGLQLEVGTAATPFEFRHYGTELALCKRYYWQIQSGTAAVDLLVNGYNYQTNQWESVIQHPVEMRTAPLVTYTAANTFVFRTGTGAPSILSYYASDPTLAKNETLIYAVCSGQTQGWAQALMSATGKIAGIYFSAEL